MNKELLINCMRSYGFYWICDVDYYNGQELVASKQLDVDDLWWRPLETEGSGFTKLFKGSVKKVCISTYTS